MDDRMQKGKIEKSIMYSDLEYNFDAILQLLSKTNFIYPDSSNIKTYKNTTYNYRQDESLPIELGEMELSIGVSDTHNYKLKFIGTALIISEEVKTQLGLETSTHGIVYIIEVPTMNYNEIKLNGNSITEFDMENKSGRSLLVIVQGVYANGENQTVAETPEISIQYEQYTMRYEIDVSDVVLS